MGRTQGWIFARVAIFAAMAWAAQAQAPVVNQGGILNAANGISPVTPGSLISIYGSNLASGTVPGDTIPLSNTINQVTVTMNGIPAPLLFVSSGQINAQVPWNVLPSGTQGTANLVVTNSGQSATGSVQVGPFSPGLFAIGSIAVAINNSDGTVAAAAGAIQGVNTRPAKISDPLGLQIWCTGLGATNLNVANGGIPASGQLATVNTFPAVLVGGVPATVLWAGLTPYYPGVNQINITLAPNTPTGNAVPIQISLGGITTASNITIAVEQ